MVGKVQGALRAAAGVLPTAGPEHPPRTPPLEMECEHREEPGRQNKFIKKKKKIVGENPCSFVN